MSRKLKPKVGANAGAIFTAYSPFVLSVFFSTAFFSAAVCLPGIASAESSLPVAGDDPLAWLERPVDCALTETSVNSRYGALISGASKNSLLSEEFKFVSSETCTGKRFASCQFSWCKPVAEAINGKVEEFAKVQSETKARTVETNSRGWEFDGDEDDELGDEALREVVPADNMVAAASDSSSRAALRSPANHTEYENSFVPPKLVLGKNAVPTLPDGAVVKGVMRVNGSFLPVTYEVPEKKFEIEEAPVVNAAEKPAAVSPLALIKSADAAVIDAPPAVPATIERAVSAPEPEKAAVVEPVVQAPAVEIPAAKAAPAAVVPSVESRIVSLVDNAEIALRTAAERELINLEKKQRERNDGRISVRVADETKKKIAWKVVEVPGASIRASFGAAKGTESNSIQGANTSEYARTIVPGIGRAPANNVVSGQEATLSRFNIATPQADRFKHADPAQPGAMPPSSILPSQGALPAGGAAAAQPKFDIGVAVPVDEGYVSPIQKMKALKATAQRR